MDVEWVRRLCLAMPHVTESVQWGDNLVFKVAGKIFVIASLEPGPQWLSFKCSEEEAAELVERPGIIPAPYLAKSHWVALETRGALPAAELRRLLKRSYELVVAKLPAKTRAAMGAK